MDRAASTSDPCTLSNTEDAALKHLELDWHVDFASKIISGCALWHAEVLRPTGRPACAPPARARVSKRPGAFLGASERASCRNQNGHHARLRAARACILPIACMCWGARISGQRTPHTDTATPSTAYGFMLRQMRNANYGIAYSGNGLDFYKLL